MCRDGKFKVIHYPKHAVTTNYNRTIIKSNNYKIPIVEQITTETEFVYIN